MKQKINLRLALIALIAIISTTIGITCVCYGLFQTQVKADLRINGKLLSDTDLFQNITPEECQVSAEKITALQKLKEDNLRITWISSDGTVLYDNDTNASDLENHLYRPEIQQAMEDGEGEIVRKSDTMNLNTFYYARKLENGTILRVSTQARSISNVLFSAIPVMLIISIVVLAACIIIGHMLTAQLLRPIERMAENLDEYPDMPIYKEMEPFAEKIRVQHENILAAATSRQDFTANVSHELKTPLTAIAGYAELIENKMVDAEQETYIACQIRKNADRLLSLINDIIKLTELDHRNLPRRFEQVELLSVAQECCANLHINAEHVGVTLNCTGEAAIVNGDRELLKEMMENLIQNAIRYNRENGWVHVETSTRDGHPVWKISDNGIGIPNDQQSRVFERFYRVDKSRSRETGGTGLGLAIVKHIAEIHHAEISLESRLGEGTSITILF